MVRKCKMHFFVTIRLHAIRSAQYEDKGMHAHRKTKIVNFETIEQRKLMRTPNKSMFTICYSRGEGVNHSYTGCCNCELDAAAAVPDGTQHPSHERS